MIMLIDTLSERYGMLPSEVIGRANTFDVFIADTAIGYRNAIQERAMNGGKAPAPEYKQSDLQAMLEKVRGKG
jgi:hypothetical protein